jgi:hypothetical protein
MSSAQAVCADCGAALAAGQDRCWLCEARIQPLGQVNPYAAPAPVADQTAAQFSLASLFLITTLVAVCLGVFLLVPGLGILLALVTAPALARTMFASYRQKQAGVASTTGQKIGTFALSFLLVFAIGWAGMIAFFCVCLGTGLAGMALGGGDEWAIGAAVTAGGLVALALSIWLLWLSRPRGVVPAASGPGKFNR